MVNANNIVEEIRNSKNWKKTMIKGKITRISGPIVLSCASKINRLNLNDVKILIDLKPALTFEVLGNRLLREFKKNNNKYYI